MEQKRLFRTGLYGFRKEDVNAYIDSLSKVVDESLSHRQQADQNAAALAKERDQHASECERLSTDLADLRARLESMQSGYDSLQERLRGYYEERVRAEHETTSLREQLARFESDLPNLAERATQYESSMRQIGEVLFSARAEAERIVSSARETASLVRSQLHDGIVRASDAVARMMIEYANIKTETQRYGLQITAIMDQLHTELTLTREHFSRLLPEIDEAPALHASAEPDLAITEETANASPPAANSVAQADSDTQESNNEVLQSAMPVK